MEASWHRNFQCQEMKTEDNQVERSLASTIGAFFRSEETETKITALHDQ